MWKLIEMGRRWFRRRPSIEVAPYEGDMFYALGYMDSSTSTDETYMHVVDSTSPTPVVNLKSSSG